MLHLALVLAIIGFALNYVIVYFVSGEIYNEENTRTHCILVIELLVSIVVVILVKHYDLPPVIGALFVGLGISAFTHKAVLEWEHIKNDDY